MRVWVQIKACLFLAALAEVANKHIALLTEDFGLEAGMLRVVSTPS